MKRRKLSKRKIDLNRNDLLPSFILPTMGGTFVSSRDLSGGRRLLLYFWGSWDAGSRRFLGALQTWYRTQCPKDLEVAAVALDVQGPPRPMEWIRRSGAQFPTLIDGPAVSCRIFGLHDVPLMMLVDARGRIVDIWEKPGTDALDRVAGDWETGGRMRAQMPRFAVDPAYEIQMQNCTNFLGRRRFSDALESLRKASALLPGARIITRQLKDLEKSLPAR